MNAISIKEIELAKWHALAIFYLRPWVFKDFTVKIGDMDINDPLSYNVEIKEEKIKNFYKSNEMEELYDWIKNKKGSEDFVSTLAKESLN